MKVKLDATGASKTGVHIQDWPKPYKRSRRTSNGARYNSSARCPVDRVGDNKTESKSTGSAVSMSLKWERSRGGYRSWPAQNGQGYLVEVGRIQQVSWHQNVTIETQTRKRVIDNKRVQWRPLDSLNVNSGAHERRDSKNKNDREQIKMLTKVCEYFFHHNSVACAWQ